MSNKKGVKIDIGFATLIVGILGFIGGTIGTFKEDLFTCIGSHNMSSSSDDFDSVNTSEGSNSNSNLDGSDSSSTDLNSSSDASDSTSSDLGSNLDGSSSSSISSSSDSDSSSDSSNSNSSDLSSTPSSTSSLSSFSSTETSAFTSEINLTLDHPMAKIELYSSCSGVAYIYKDFLDRHYIGKITENGQLTGWGISLHMTDQTVSFIILPKQTQNECYYDIELNSSKTLFDQNKIQNQISAELTENGDLKIMFNFINIPIDLSSTYEIMPGTISGSPNNNIS